MKRKTLSAVLLVSGFILFSIVSSSLAMVSAREVSRNSSFAFATQETIIVDDDVSRTNREDWFYIENVQPGLMTVEVAWGNTYNLNCYISTTASRYTALASGISTANPESCSYTIQTAGTYYFGIVLSTNGRTDTTPYTATITYFSGEDPNPDTIDPVVSITAPISGVTVGDTISIAATASDADSGIDYLSCSFDGNSLGSDFTEPFGWTFDTTTIVNGIYDIVVTAYDVAGNFATDTISVEVYNEDDPIPGDGEKIAVFFWASDAGAQWVIDEYWAVLQNEGYTKMFNFEDTSDFEADFNTVDDYENPEDTVFFYLFGHGNNNGEDSLTAFAPGTSIVYSSELRVMFDRLDAERIGYLVESCHSGGFPVDFHAAPYLAMSTSDEDHNSYAISTIPGEGLFSDAFFNHVDDGFNAVDSFYYAEQVVFDNARNPNRMQYPLIADYSTYVWFA
ncbi:MAG: Ig-like domain-containing protein [Promethearchaeota archaeon]